jgi:hypothetical protein
MAKGTGRAPIERTIGKRVTFDSATWHALDLYARDSMKSFQELADEAFRDLLEKHGRPVDVIDALRRSARQTAANDNPEQPKPAPTDAGNAATRRMRAPRRSGRGRR